MNQSERRIYLIQELLKENAQYRGMDIPTNAEEQRMLLRGLMNIRMPHIVSREVLEVQDAYLEEEKKRKGIVDVDSLEEIQSGIILWQGDITKLACDAIVNAANSGMTGCYVPNHRCIDNCIHTFAGMQLRQECEEIMEKQGYAEPTGQVKITKAYNLPCKHILHTVGPIIRGPLTKRDRDLLRSCYTSCLTLAAEKGLESVAFCCISTGEFHFPNDKAAEIAVDAVKEFLQKNTSVRKVIFNVFKELDKTIYTGLLQ